MTEAFTPKFTEGEIIEKIQALRNTDPFNVIAKELQIEELEKELALLKFVTVGEDEQIFFDECSC